MKRTLGVMAVPKVTLFRIHRPKDSAPRDGDMGYKCGPDWTENVVLKREVTYSSRVREG